MRIITVHSHLLKEPFKFEVNEIWEYYTDTDKTDRIVSALIGDMNLSYTEEKC